jgi:hypothetical protein
MFFGTADNTPATMSSAANVLAVQLTSAAAAAGNAAVPDSEDRFVMQPLQWTLEPPGLGRNSDYVPLCDPAATSVLAAHLTSAAAAAGDAAVPGSEDCYAIQPLQWTPEPPGLDCSADDVPATIPAAAGLLAAPLTSAAAASGNAAVPGSKNYFVMQSLPWTPEPLGLEVIIKPSHDISHGGVVARVKVAKDSKRVCVCHRSCGQESLQFEKRCRDRSAI